MKLQAFHNDPKLKADLLAEVEKHRLADAIVARTYGEMLDGRFIGCAVGCSIESLNRLRGQEFATGDHDSYPELVGVPAWLAHLQDRLFEGMPDARQPLWPGQFWSAIRPGADLEAVKAPLLVFVLTRALTTFDHSKHPDVAAAIHRVIELYLSGGSADAAYAAARTAADAAYAAYAADATYAAYAAYAAAYAALAADAAAYATYAADAADAADAARAAADAAYATANNEFADKLLALMEAV